MAIKHKRAAIVGDGVSGLFAAIALTRRQWDVTLFSKATPAAGNQPYICPDIVTRMLSEECPEVLDALVKHGVCKISVADIIEHRFSNPKFHSTQDTQSAFFGCKASLLKMLLNDVLKKRDNFTVSYEEIVALMHEGSQITGVQLENMGLRFDIVIDATGSAGSRKNWLSQSGLAVDAIKHSPSFYNAYMRTYKYIGQAPLHFQFVSKRNMRGGLYPLENNTFAICFFSTDPKADFDQMLNESKEFTGIVKNATETPGTHTVRHLQSRCSDYYERRSATRNIRGFFPLGDTVYMGNPVYGRGITLAMMQIKKLAVLLQNEDNFESVHEQFAQYMREMKTLWRFGQFRDLADAKNLSIKTVCARVARAYYDNFLSPLIKKDVAFLRDFLYLYQLRASPYSLLSPKYHMLGFIHFIERRFNV